MIPQADIRWVESESHDWKWDNTTKSREEWQRRQAEVVDRMRATIEYVGSLEQEVRSLEGQIEEMNEL